MKEGGREEGEGERGGIIFLEYINIIYKRYIRIIM